MSFGPPPEPNAQAPAPAPAPAPQQGVPAGPGLAVASVVLGIVSCALPLLPFNMDTWRPYVTFPLGLGGLILAIGACTGGRRGKPLAVTGVVLCGLALCLGVFMVGGTAGDVPAGRPDPRRLGKESLVAAAPGSVGSPVEPGRCVYSPQKEVPPTCAKAS